MKHGLPRILKTCLLEAPAIFVLIWLGGFVMFAASIPHKAETETTTTDVIVVLTGGKLRVAEGLKLLADGKAPVLFISGVGEGVRLSELLAANSVASVDIEKVDQNKIFLGREAATTNGNALETAEWVNKHQAKSIRLVTANYHMRRSLLELEAEMPTVNIVPHPVFPDAELSGNWWSSMDAASFIAAEYNKYLLALFFVKVVG